MPSSARKSSIGGARRTIQKAHIPYRGDNPEVGKKTGIAVAHVERMSDGFEPFEELLQQADKRPAPKPKGRKKSVPKTQQQEYDDQDGEMSMELDDTPLRHLSNVRMPSTPTLRNTSGSSRVVARTSEIDFDDIPSPRPRSSTSRTAKAGQSSLLKSTSSRNFAAESDSDNEPADYGSYMNDMDISAVTDLNGNYEAEDHDPPSPPSPIQKKSPKRKSFAQIDQDDVMDDEQGDGGQEEEEEPEEEPPETPPRIDKGKRKAVLEDIQEEQEAEHEVEQDLNDVEQYGSGEDEPQPSPPPKKKQRFAEEKERPKKISSSRLKKENRESREGIRRSQRERFKPLEWWRGEKVVYGRTNHSGPVLVPAIKEIRRIPSDAPQPLNYKKRGYHRGRSKTADDKAASAVYNPEEGWDDATDPFGEVHDMDKQALVVRRLVWTAKRVTLSKAGNSDWLFEKVFGDSDFVAAGQLVIPPECRKPTKATKDNTYIFYVIEGAVNFKVHEVSKVVATGGMFIAPRGNTYFIENISKRAARLFFTQARKVPKDDNEGGGSVTPHARRTTLESEQRREKKKSLEEVRSSSPGRPLAGTGGRAAQSMPPTPSQAKQTKGKAKKRAPSAKV